MSRTNKQVDQLRRLADRDTLAAELDHHVAAVERIMKEIHGGTWRIDISYQARFVLVAWVGD